MFDGASRCPRVEEGHIVNPALQPRNMWSQRGHLPQSHRANQRESQPSGLQLCPLTKRTEPVMCLSTATLPVQSIHGERLSSLTVSMIRSTVLPSSPPPTPLPTNNYLIPATRPSYDQPSLQLQQRKKKKKSSCQKMSQIGCRDTEITESAPSPTLLPFRIQAFL